MTTEVTDRLTLSIAEAAQVLGISRNSCYLAVKTGELPSIKIGSRILIPRLSLERMLAEAGREARHE
ncbi:MAG: helix-turn-helix domain-containing protein [Chloroflexi bacterium]|nr:helix-turn-helix domain-containing protein [Chloroflexota bacterium]